MEHQTPFKDSIIRLVKRRSIIFSICWLAFLILLALFAPIIANDKPFYLSYDGSFFFPTLSGDANGVVQDKSTGKIITVDFLNPGIEIEEKAFIIPSPIPYSPHKSDLNNADYTGPFDMQTNQQGTELTGAKKHLLGTGRRGEDILSGIIHGSRVSMTVGIFSMTIAGIIGLVLGAVSGYFGDNRLTLSRGRILMTFAGILPAWFYGFQLRAFDLEEGLNSSAPVLFLQLFISVTVAAVVLYLFNQSGRLLHFIKWFKKESRILADSLISRLIEILISLPKLILIISIAAISKPSLVNLILIIGLTSWTEIARFTRAEMLRVRSLDYIQSARSLGFSERRIIFLHALPNAIAPALITISFGIAGAILMESALSFLGIGVPPDIATWGSLLASGKENFSAWWLVVFPGLAIFITVTAFNLLGEGLRDAFDPKMKS